MAFRADPTDDRRRLAYVFDEEEPVSDDDLVEIFAPADRHGVVSLAEQEAEVMRRVRRWTRQFYLTLPVKPWVVIARDDDDQVRERVAALTTDGVIRHLDPAHMTEESSLFCEFATKLNFHSYFGHHWDALVDCLDDLHCIPPGPVAIVVEHAEELVDKAFFPTFVDFLCQAAVRVNLPLDADDLPRDRPPRPLHFVFFVADVDLGALAEGLRARDGLVITEAGSRLLVHSDINQ